MKTLIRTKVVYALCAVCSLGSVTALEAAEPASPTYNLDIPAQNLNDGLQTFALASQHKLIYSSDLVDGKKSPALKGKYTTEEALTKLLAGTNLRYEVTSSGLVMIRAVDPTLARSAKQLDPPSDKEGKKDSSGGFRLAQAAAGQAGENAAVEKPEESASKKKPIELEEIVVTGTYLHRVEPLSPLTTLTHEDLVNQGYTRLDDAIAQLPQNFQAGASVQSNPVLGAGNGASYNYDYSSGVNLRGLGSSATLVLLNGRRLAPTAFGGVTDISTIPVSIVDRVEILPDGASALYGSDAVAGVVNVITKRDYSGVEFSGRSTGISEGKAPNYGADVLGGFRWNSGGVVLSFDHEDDKELLARNRSFLGNPPDPWFLLPKNEASSYYASVHDEPTDRLQFSTDILVSRRQYESQDLFGPTNPAPYVASGRASRYSASVQSDYKLSSQWTATLVAAASKEPDKSSLVYGGFGFQGQEWITYRVLSVEPRIDGALFEWTGGTARTALGAQWRQESFADTQLQGGLTGPLSTVVSAATTRHVNSLYGELLIPIVGDNNALPFVQRFRIDVSGRYDHYNDFGGSTNPKISAEWVPMKSISVHGTYAKSFQAPTLYQLTPEYLAAYVLPVPDPKSPTGSSLVIDLDGNNPNLKPETATSYTLGASYAPMFASGLKLNASFFSIAFDNQINRLILLGFLETVLEQEAVLGSLVQRNPSLSSINQVLNSSGRTIFNYAGGNFTPGPYTPAQIAAIANIGFVNSASVLVRGLDLTANYLGPENTFGRLRADIAGTYFTTYRERITPTANALHPTNTVYNPLRFRAKADVGWNKAGWGANARINYSNAYNNSLNADCATTHSCGIGAWTTVDFSLSHAGSPVGRNTFWEGIRINVDVTNLFNRKPPVVTQPAGFVPLQYDEVNANPFLRMVAVTLTKSWGGR